MAEKNGVYLMITPYKWEEISTTRFKLDTPPPPREFLVEGLLAQGVVGTVYSRGGIGKSILLLDLAIRVALAAKGVESDWLCKFPVSRGGKVIIVTGEDPEDEIEGRLYHRIQAIASENQVSHSFIRRAIQEQIAVVNFWGSSDSYGLFRKENGKLASSPSHEKLRMTVEAEKPVLVIFDTRSRFNAGAIDENSNSEVAAEVTHYETFAKCGATILIAHHANKSSYGEGGSNPGAFRGASAWQDNLRWAMLLSSTGAGSESLIRVEVPKSNYTKPIRPFILRRLDNPPFAFALVEEGSVLDPKEARLEEDLKKVMDYLRTHPSTAKTALMKALKGHEGKPGILAWHRADKAVKYGLQSGELVDKGEGGIWVGENHAPSSEEGDDEEVSDFGTL
jgi:hypothetical protein